LKNRKQLHSSLNQDLPKDREFPVRFVLLDGQGKVILGVWKRLLEESCIYETNPPKVQDQKLSIKL